MYAKMLARFEGIILGILGVLRVVCLRYPNHFQRLRGPSDVSTQLPSSVVQSDGPLNWFTVFTTDKSLEYDQLFQVILS